MVEQIAALLLEDEVEQQQSRERLVERAREELLSRQASELQLAAEYEQLQRSVNAEIDEWHRLHEQQRAAALQRVRLLQQRQEEVEAKLQQRRQRER